MLLSSMENEIYTIFFGVKKKRNTKSDIQRRLSSFSSYKKWVSLLFVSRTLKKKMDTHTHTKTRLFVHICHNNANISEKNDWIISPDIGNVIAIHIFSFLSLELFVGCDATYTQTHIYTHLPIPIVIYQLSLYLFLNEAFNVKGSDYNLLFTPNKMVCVAWENSRYFFSIPFGCRKVTGRNGHEWEWDTERHIESALLQAFFRQTVNELYMKAICLQNASSLSKQNYVECAHENLNGPW